MESRIYLISCKSRAKTDLSQASFVDKKEKFNDKLGKRLQKAVLTSTMKRGFLSHTYEDDVAMSTEAQPTESQKPRPSTQRILLSSETSDHPSNNTNRLTAKDKIGK